MKYEDWQCKYWEDLISDYDKSEDYLLITFDQFCKRIFDERKDDG